MTCNDCKYFFPYRHGKYDGFCRFDPHFEWRKKTSWCGKCNTGKVRRVKSSPEYSDEFKAFWEVYPKKTAQDAAWKAWRDEDKLPPQHYQLAIKQAGAYAVAVKDKDVNYVKHPLTWINGGCWKDVLGKKKVDSKDCVDCGKAFTAGHKYGNTRGVPRYRCVECRA